MQEKETCHTSPKQVCRYPAGITSDGTMPIPITYQWAWYWKHFDIPMLNPN